VITLSGFYCIALNAEEHGVYFPLRKKFGEIEDGQWKPFSPRNFGAV
jgi:hypothetical protein